MTSIAGFLSKDAIWIVADRRLSFANGKSTDDAVKLMIVDCSDGRCLIGYAGLGKTALGMEPSEWLRRTVRGYNLSVEETLTFFANAIVRQFPKHLSKTVGLANGGHALLACAMVDDAPRLYTVTLVVDRFGKVIGNNFTRQVISPETIRPPAVVYTGSGYPTGAGRTRERRALSLINKHNKGKIKAKTVADYLSFINLHAAQGDCRTSPSSIVLYRYSNNSIHGNGGGYFCYQSDFNRENLRAFNHNTFTGKIFANKTDCCSIPSVSRGTDMSLVTSVFLKYINEKGGIEKAFSEDNDIKSEMNSRLEKEDWKSDENLK